jgi:hypothetical protein
VGKVGVEIWRRRKRKTLSVLKYGISLENRDFRELGKLKKQGALPIALPIALPTASATCCPFLTHRVDGCYAPAISDGHRCNRSWAREHSVQRDEAWFKREAAPKLDAFSLKEIGKATGLSLAACSRFRAGAKVPHSRHWGTLRQLTHS